MIRISKLIIFILTLGLSFITSFCSTLKKMHTTEAELLEQINDGSELPQTETITLLFAGDIMCHEENFTMGKFEKIWEYVKPFTLDSDLAFANLEAPVNDSMPWKTYPQFNTHSEYVQAAMDAGFNVFSTANNHSSDQYLKGVKSTKEFFKQKQTEGIWSSGLRENDEDPIDYTVAECWAEDGSLWKVLFVAYTEILNDAKANACINYHPHKKADMDILKQELVLLDQQVEHDLFVLSIHSSDVEYDLSLSTDRKEFYRSLVNECGVDIVWSNHPHVMKEFEKIDKAENQNGSDALIMYANGNTISGQRDEVWFHKPEHPLEYTGEGLLLKLKVSRTKDTSSQADSPSPLTFSDFEPMVVTALITSEDQLVLRPLDDTLIDSLDRAGSYTWKKYLSRRKELCEEILQRSKY